ncbi:MAG TPA: DUF1990 domain-containing protein, partial [Ilumatobacteraceae bacterium]|nr:DUF1990 domain-containing protein [Ilumatobacteraceae bacterium]
VPFRLTRPEPEALRSLVEGGAFDELSYELVGLSKLAEAPPGFRMDRRTCVLGRGDEVFDAAVHALREWQVHRGSGMVVLADDEPRTDLVVAMSAPLPLGFLDLVCRVVDTVDQQDQFGFTYGTLSVHPAQGEESFTVTRGADFDITFDILAVSRPRMWAARACPPIARAMQHRATGKYLRAMQSAASGSRR